MSETKKRKLENEDKEEEEYVEPIVTLQDKLTLKTLPYDTKLNITNYLDDTSKFILSEEDRDFKVLTYKFRKNYNSEYRQMKMKNHTISIELGNFWRDLHSPYKVISVSLKTYLWSSESQRYIYGYVGKDHELFQKLFAKLEENFSMNETMNFDQDWIRDRYGITSIVISLPPDTDDTLSYESFINSIYHHLNETMMEGHYVVFKKTFNVDKIKFLTMPPSDEDDSEDDEDYFGEIEIEVKSKEKGLDEDDSELDEDDSELDKEDIDENILKDHIPRYLFF